MKKSELIKKLEEIPGDPEVAILDWRKHALDDLSEGTGSGIYTDFRIEKIEDTEEREGVSSEEQALATWIAFSYTNESFDNEFTDKPRHCRVCGCAEDNGQPCMETTGEARHWIEADLCSACS
jgi:hypothetical protein